MYDEGSTLRGIFLTGCIAFFLFSTYILGFHLNHPEDMTVEPEVTEYEYCFYQPDLVEFIPAEECETSASSVDSPASSECQSTSLLNTGPPTAGEWWAGFSTLGMLLSSGICLACVWFAEYENR